MIVFYLCTSFSADWSSSWPPVLAKNWFKNSQFHSYIVTCIRRLLTKFGSDPSILAEENVCGVGQSLGFGNFLEKNEFFWRHRMMSELFELPTRREVSFSD